jgi:hypothetical protein
VKRPSLSIFTNNNLERSSNVPMHSRSMWSTVAAPMNAVLTSINTIHANVSRKYSRAASANRRAGILVRTSSRPRTAAQRIDTVSSARPTEDHSSRIDTLAQSLEARLPIHSSHPAKQCSVGLSADLKLTTRVSRDAWPELQCRRASEGMELQGSRKKQCTAEWLGLAGEWGTQITAGTCGYVEFSGQCNGCP